MSELDEIMEEEDIRGKEQVSGLSFEEVFFSLTFYSYLILINALMCRLGNKSQFLF